MKKKIVSFDITALASATALFLLPPSDSLKLASIVIRNYVKNAKMAIFRCEKMHVRFKLET